MSWEPMPITDATAKLVGMCPYPPCHQMDPRASMRVSHCVELVPDKADDMVMLAKCRRCGTVQAVSLDARPEEYQASSTGAGVR